MTLRAEQPNADTPKTNAVRGQGYSKSLVGALLGCWFLAVIGGMAILMGYSMQPGVAAQPPSKWPDNAVVVREPGRRSLLMAVHPRCPCSQATLEELAKVMRYVTKPVQVVVLFVRPVDMTVGWERASLWEKAAQIPGVVVRVDEGGAAARAFGMSVSGTTSIYDETGNLLFAGGITSSRGHVGDNNGSDAVTAFLNGQAAHLAETPVYGCSLFAPCRSGDSHQEGGIVEPCCQ